MHNPSFLPFSCLPSQIYLSMSLALFLLAAVTGGNDSVLAAACLVTV
jgi:hypothetical protein